MLILQRPSLGRAGCPKPASQKTQRFNAHLGDQGIGPLRPTPTHSGFSFHDGVDVCLRRGIGRPTFTQKFTTKNPSPVGTRILTRPCLRLNEQPSAWANKGIRPYQSINKKGWKLLASSPFLNSRQTYVLLRYCCSEELLGIRSSIHADDLPNGVCGRGRQVS